MSNFGRHFQVVFDNSPVGMAILDSEGRFLYTNRALQRMFGYSKDELHARPFFEFLLPDDTEELTSQFAKIVEKENSHVRSESRYLPRDQHEAWARF
ncbi:MAG: PAS domain S-box protein, partial [Spirochaetales bacterium]|nr:PAS domain S-box protein [Spirochaetales bacterium]MCF7939885.1 PAS domain S-box protein [Spirochaetales bacterium]